MFMNSASTDLNGCIGRALKAGDILGVNKVVKARASYTFQPYPLSDLPIRLQPGPQANAEILDMLTRAPFRISSADRMGIRLQGSKIRSYDLISEATPMGAVQITTQGDPIILLNDRGRIGGYAKPAVVDPRDLHRLTQVRPGQILHFSLSGG
jgi:allophanate hydrolase subunit 2